jgi:hypothetical protein
MKKRGRKKGLIGYWWSCEGETVVVVVCCVVSKHKSVVSCFFFSYFFLLPPMLQPEPIASGEEAFPKERKKQSRLVCVLHTPFSPCI